MKLDKVFAFSGLWFIIMYVISFMQGIYNYVCGTNHVSRAGQRNP
jgi:hypothetical protein